MDLRKTAFILPNLFTLSAMFCGFYAIALCMGDTSHTVLYKASISIWFAVLFDLFDGKIARLTNTQSDMGVQLDSLSDLISFGVAPSILIYKWALQPYGKLGIAISFLFLACGALRLARFNVMSNNKSSPKYHFIGLPIPVAAGTITSLVVANHHVGETVIRSPLNLTVFTLILAYMMVSNIKFRNFKKLSLKRDEISNTIILAIFLPFSLVVAKVVNPMFIFIYLCASYIAVGLVEEVIFYKKRKIHGVTLVNDSQQDLESDVTNR